MIHLCFCISQKLYITGPRVGGFFPRGGIWQYSVTVSMPHLREVTAGLSWVAARDAGKQPAMLHRAIPPPAPAPDNKELSAQSVSDGEKLCSILFKIRKNRTLKPQGKGFNHRIQQSNFLLQTTFWGKLSNIISFNIRNWKRYRINSDCPCNSRCKLRSVSFAQWDPRAWCQSSEPEFLQSWAFPELFSKSPVGLFWI